MKEFGAPSVSRLEALFDPNDWRVVERDETGARYAPLTTNNYQRVGARERLLSVAKQYPDLLRIELNALATRVLFDDRNRAIGVEYQKGERLYSAHPNASTGGAETRMASARREVILAGGAFNTPQLLMLSGIGDPGLLAKCGIRARVPLAGVGRNLQDRYEVAVVNKMNEAVGRAERRHVHDRRSAVSRLGEPAQRHLCHQRFAALRDPALRARQAGARPLLLCLAGRFPRLPTRILGDRASTP